MTDIATGNALCFHQFFRQIKDRRLNAIDLMNVIFNMTHKTLGLSETMRMILLCQREVCFHCEGIVIFILALHAARGADQTDHDSQNIFFHGCFPKWQLKQKDLD